MKLLHFMLSGLVLTLAGFTTFESTAAQRASCQWLRAPSVAPGKIPRLASCQAFRNDGRKGLRFNFYGKPPNEVKAIRVYVGDRLLQTLRGFTVEPPRGGPQWFVLQDMNFDGYVDFRVMEFMPAGASIPYVYFLWDRKARRFVRSKVLGDVTLPRFDARRKLVVSTWRSNAAHSGSDYYRWAGARLVKVRRVERKYSDARTCVRTVTDYERGRAVRRKRGRCR